ncbi:helix-turn-helix domain-containing protein [Vallitalea sediminicola]
MEGVPVTDACYLVGFNDYSNFYKKFKKIVGLSPKKYVKDFTYISKPT